MKYSPQHTRSRFIISIPPIKEIYKFLTNQLYDKIVENFELRLYNAEGNFMKSKFVCLSSILFGSIFLSSCTESSKDVVDNDSILSVSKGEKLLDTNSRKEISEQMNKLRQQMTKKKCNCKKNRE